MDNVRGKGENPVDFVDVDYPWIFKNPWIIHTFPWILVHVPGTSAVLTRFTDFRPEIVSKKALKRFFWVQGIVHRVRRNPCTKIVDKKSGTRFVHG